MSKFYCLILFVNALLAGSFQIHVVHGTALIAKLVPSGELTREELFAELHRLNYGGNSTASSSSGSRNTDEIVAESLYRTKDKESTEVVSGITIAKLIEQNSFHGLRECSLESFRKRVRVLAELEFSAETLPKEILFGLNVYVYKCLDKVARYCLGNKNQVIQEGFNEEKWFRGLEEKMWAPADIEANIYESLRSSLALYIVDGRKDRWSCIYRTRPLAETQVQRHGSLLVHPKTPSDELSQEELLTRLGQLTRDSYVPIAEFVLENLYKTKNKATTMVLNGTSVEELIAQSRFNSLDDCKMDEFKKRTRVYSKISRLEPAEPSGSQKEIFKAIRFYLAACFYLVADYCTTAQVTSQAKSEEIIDKEWMFDLYIFRQSQIDLPYIKEKIYDSRPLTLPKYLEPAVFSLIRHQEPSSELTKQELLDELDRLSNFDEAESSSSSSTAGPKHKLEEIVAEKLYKTKDKSSTEIVSGVTVAKLIEQNSFSLSKCSRESFKLRLKELAKVDFGVEVLAEGRLFPLSVYVYKCLNVAVRYCLANKDEVISEGINERGWLNDLGANMWVDTADVKSFVRNGRLLSTALVKQQYD